MKSKLICIILSAIVTVANLAPVAFADTDSLMTLEELREENGAITVEAYNIGQGFLVEPTLYRKEGKSTGDITVDFLESKNINFKGSTSYFSGIEFDDMIEAVYPDYLEAYLSDFDNTGDGDGYLSEFDYTSYSGWCYTINDWWASYGADSSYPGSSLIDYNTGEEVVLGDVIRWHYTVYNYGADCGFSSNVMAEWTGGNLFVQEDKTELIFILAAINDYYGNSDIDDVYETALEVAANPLASCEEIKMQIEILTSYIENNYLNTNPDAESIFRITECDEEKVYFTFPEEGIDITLVFADYDNENFVSVKSVPVVTEKTNGKNIMYVAIPDEINISFNDKIMLWEGFSSCMPLCRAFVVGGTLG